MNNIILPDWPAPQHIKALTTTRFGGVSQKPYQDFNLGAHVGDNPLAVAQNRQILREQLSLRNEPLWLNQVHGNEIIQADITEKTTPTADGSFTQKPNVVCTIMTADCLPILLCDRAGKQVAAIHGGWRSLAADIIDVALKQFAIPGQEILAWLGPAIGPEVFEVGDEVRDMFIAQDPQAELAFIATKPGKWLCNIYLIARQHLNKRGVTAIYGGNFCTYAESDRFFSYRRDQTTGRMASMIWKEE